MKKIIGIGLFFLFISLQLKAQNSDSTHNKVYWNQDSTLIWEDFQGIPDTSSQLSAYSTFSLPFGFTSDGEGEIWVTLKVFLAKKDSWVIKAEENDLLLKHEQVHFDIAELYRRKIIKALKNTSLTKINYMQKINDIINRYWTNEYKSRQNEYDKDSDYSRNIKGQIKWTKLIKKEIQEYDDYTAVELRLSLINFEDE